MAYRLVNVSKQPLTIDLRSGKSVTLAPGATSPPLREEALYDNPYLGQWEAAGFVQRIAARFDDLLAHEDPSGVAQSSRASAAKGKAKKNDSSAERATERRPSGRAPGRGRRA